MKNCGQNFAFYADYIHKNILNKPVKRCFVKICIGKNAILCPIIILPEIL